ncbi:MAG: ATP-dependent dethiobiotin synthetase BioD [Hormoscilla sp. GUM202]|nr:ATP-dependent dethiobiotin synthetase BioD [Hormoscilla sp. GUM202]
MNTLLITGTDTDAGKTVLTTCLAAYWQTYYPDRSLGIMKPIQAGKGDRELYIQLFSLSESPEEITPLYFQTPIAPPIAARREGKLIELAKVWQTFNSLQQKKDWLLVEALGGLGSPVTEELTVADIARDWRLPVALVVPVKLGAIGQAVANVALARQCEIEIEGIVLNCINPCSDEQLADWTPIDLIESLTGGPVLGILPHLADPKDLTKLAQVASNLDLERLLPGSYSGS